MTGQKASRPIASLTEAEVRAELEDSRRRLAAFQESRREMQSLVQEALTELRGDREKALQLRQEILDEQAARRP